MKILKNSILLIFFTILSLQSVQASKKFINPQVKGQALDSKHLDEFIENELDKQLKQSNKFIDEDQEEYYFEKIKVSKKTKND